MTRPPPTDEPEAARELVRRVKAVEDQKSVRVGDLWLTYRDGSLVVSDGTGNRTTLVSTDSTTGELLLPTPAEIGAVSKSDITQSVNPPPDGGGPLSLISQLLSGKWLGLDTTDGKAVNAQYTADNAYATAAAIEARLNAGNGYYFNDTFDGDYPSDLGPQYFRTLEGAGGGTYRSDATGLAHQTVLGGIAVQAWIDRHVTPTTTNSQTISTTLNQIPNPGGGVGTSPARHTLMANMDATNADRVEGRVENGFCAIGYTLGGNYTEIGSRAIAMDNGDRWDWLVDDSTRTFILLRNKLEALRWQDIGLAYPMDASHRYGGASNMAGTTVFNFFFTTQTYAPSMQSLNVADYNP